MVQLWSALATRDASLMTQALSGRETPANTGGAAYVRGHDDIGWAISDAQAEAAGLEGAAHRRFLNDFYSGRFPGSFARGALFQENPRTGDARISGTTASLCGLEQALTAGDEGIVEQAIRRLLLLHSVCLSYGAVPLLYMGDELGLHNDLSYLEEPVTAADNRWMHRPRMDWVAAARRGDASSVEARVFASLRELIACRRSLPSLHASVPVRPLAANNRRIFAYARAHPRRGRFLGLVNFNDAPESCDAGVLAQAGLVEPRGALGPSGHFEVREGRIHLPGLGFAWLVER